MSNTPAAWELDVEYLILGSGGLLHYLLLNHCFKGKRAKYHLLGWSRVRDSELDQTYVIFIIIKKYLPSPNDQRRQLRF